MKLANLVIEWLKATYPDECECSHIPSTHKDGLCGFNLSVDSYGIGTHIYVSGINYVGIYDNYILIYDDWFKLQRATLRIESVDPQFFEKLEAKLTNYIYSMKKWWDDAIKEEYQWYLSEIDAELTEKIMSGGYPT